MSKLAEKMRRAREFDVQIEGHKFTVRRPTDAELLDLSGSKAFDFACRFVVGWDVKELDMIPGGGPDVVPFDVADWVEWLGDRSDLWEPLSKAIVDSYKAHEAATKENEKN